MECFSRRKLKDDKQSEIVRLTKPTKNLSWKNEIRLRNEHLQQQCKNMSEEYITIRQLIERRKEFLTNIIVDDKNKLLYCYIPKVMGWNIEQF